MGKGSLARLEASGVRTTTTVVHLRQACFPNQQVLFVKPPSDADGELRSSNPCSGSYGDRCYGIALFSLRWPISPICPRCILHSTLPFQPLLYPQPSSIEPLPHLSSYLSSCSSTNSNRDSSKFTCTEPRRSSRHITTMHTALRQRDSHFQPCRRRQQDPEARTFDSWCYSHRGPSLLTPACLQGNIVRQQTSCCCEAGSWRFLSY